MRKIAMHRRHWSGGMPDLVLWRERKGSPRGGDAMVVEVKSKNDQLADKQKAWIQVLREEAGIDTRVLRFKDPE